MSIKPMSGMDSDNRDPNNLNEHLQVMWDDVIGEPEGLKSTDCAWNCSHQCFKGTKNCCYLVLTTLFAPCLAFCAAINFACLAFQHIWCIIPCVRTMKINCAVIRICNQICCEALYGPAADVIARLLSKVKVKYQKLPDGDDDNEVDIMHIWCMGPFLRSWKINCAFFRTCHTVACLACCGPCAEVCGLYFSKIKVRYQRLPDSNTDEEKDIMLV